MTRVAVGVLACLPLGVLAAGEPEFNILIENHKFTPERVEVPAGKKVKLVIENKDTTPEEFESHTLRIEKIIPGKTKASVFVGPLKAGEYKFFGEFNESTAKGVLVVK